MITPRTDYVLDGSGPFPQHVAECPLANAGTGNNNVEGRVADDEDPPEMEHSSGQIRMTAISKGLNLEMNRYFERCVNGITWACQWTGCQLVRFGLGVQRISGSLYTWIVGPSNERSTRQNDDEFVIEDDVTHSDDDGDDAENLSALGQDPCDEVEGEETKVTEPAGDVSGHVTITKAPRTLRRSMTPQESFEEDEPLSEMAIGKVEHETLADVKEVKFVLYNGKVVTSVEDVTYDDIEDPENPYDLHFFRNAYEKNFGEVLEFEGSRETLYFLRPDSCVMLALLETAVYDTMPVNIADPLKWYDIAMKLASGSVYKRSTANMFFRAHREGEGSSSMQVPAPRTLSPRMRTRSVEIANEIGEEGYCWLMLFKNRKLVGSHDELPPLITRQELEMLASGGHELSEAKSFGLTIENGIFHVNEEGTMSSTQVIEALPFAWSRLGSDTLGADRTDSGFEMFVGLNFTSVDELFLSMSTLVFTMFVFIKSMCDESKLKLTNSKWLVKALHLLSDYIALVTRCSALGFGLLMRCGKIALWVIDTCTPMRIASRVKIWVTLSTLYGLVIALKLTLKLRVLDLIAISTVLSIAAVIVAPNIVAGIIAVSVLSLWVVTQTVGSRSRLAGLTNSVASLTSYCLVQVLQSPLKPVLKFIIHARLTMWIKLERPIRGQLLKTVWVGDRVVHITDRYNANDDIDELAAVLMALSWGTWGMMALSTFSVTLVTVMLTTTIVQISRVSTRAVVAWAAWVKFVVGIAVLLIVLPDIGVDSFMYALLYTRLLVVGLSVDAFSVMSSLWRTFGVKMAVLKETNFNWTPKTIAGYETHVMLPEIKIALFRAKTVSVLRYNIVRFIVAVENVNLPKLLVKQYTSPSEQSLKESMQILKDLGWPVNVEITGNKMSKTSAMRTYKEWFMTNTTFIQPLRNIKAVISEESHLFDFLVPPVFKYTGSYTSVQREVESTSRYFKNNVTEGDIDVDDDVWTLLHEHFEHSRLARTALVVNKLIKKYSVGFGFMDPLRPKTLTRKVLMKMIGGEAELVKLFDRTLANIGKIVPVAHVFTKFETLKESKWAKGLVRTIVGVPLAHYSNTSKFSYMQNLRHPFESSPIKVGMPLTGAWFADIWNDHSKREHHFNGDLKLADSSYSKEIFDVIKACRKRGFSSHKDYDQICDMIDIAYDQLMSMPLAFKSTGEVAFKGAGGATGQGNTSVDNSVALVVLYLASWRRVTGKSVKEFQLFNTLSNQADDHILSWDENNLGWCPEAWMKEFSRLGVTLTDESSSDKLEDASFLAKKIVIDHQTEERKLLKYGIKAPRFLTCHDKNRLLGKIAAEQPLRDHQARAKRLVSYLYLTAHHEDVYRTTQNAIRRLQAKCKRDLGVKIPPYSAIMRAWYTKKDTHNQHFAGDRAMQEDLEKAMEAYDEFGDIGTTVHITEPKALEVVLICLSILPQIFSPRFMTSPALRHIHKLLGERVAWPIEMLRRRNSMLHTPGALASALVKTNYDFLNGVDLAGVVSRRSDFSIMISHWLFTIMQWLFLGGNGPKGINMLLRSADGLFANAYFVCFGQISEVVEAVGFGYFDTMLVVICDMIPDMAYNIKLPRIPQVIPSDIITRAITRLWRNVQPSAGIDFESVELMVSKPGFFGSNVIIEAPTGVGKSTRMIARLAAITAGRRIIVVEPRHILVTGLTDYMNKIDPTTGYGAATTGRTPSVNDRVIYCTYQSMVMCNFGRDSDIVVVDEAHIKDPVYKFAVEDLLSRKCTTLLVTATPNPEWVHTSTQFVRVEVAPLWRVKEHVLNVGSIAAYRNQVIQMCRSIGPSDKALVFMPTTRQCSDLLKELPGHGCIISSKHPNVDDTAQFFVSTRVSDAGLTLPDVSFVFSMDIEWGVSSDVVEFDILSPVSKTGHYRIDELTVKQRKGRTGRTCDGTFFLFQVAGDHSPRQTTDKDLLDDLVQLLEKPYIESRLPTSAAELWDKYKEISIEWFGGETTPQNLLGMAEHSENPSDYKRAQAMLTAMYGQPGSTSVVCFDPLAAPGMFPDTVDTTWEGIVKVDEEHETHLEALQFWGLTQSTEEGVRLAKQHQVIDDVNDDGDEQFYPNEWDDNMINEEQLEEEETKENENDNDSDSDGYSTAGE